MSLRTAVANRRRHIARTINTVLILLFCCNPAHSQTSKSRAKKKAAAKSVATSGATGEAAFFRLPAPGGFVVTPDLVTLIVSLPESAQLVFFDTVTNVEQKRIDMDFKPGAMAIQGGTLFVASHDGSGIYGLDLQTGAVKSEFTLPANSIAHVACHSEKGLLYASTADLSVFSVDPADGSVTKTAATGTFLAVDPVNGMTVYTGAQPRQSGVVLIIKEEDDVIRLIWDRWGCRAAILKCAVKGKQLKVETIQDNAACNGWQMHLTPDGKRIMIIGGGGWRPPAEGGTGGGYVTAVFKSDNVKSMAGQAPHGSGIIFHPLLNFGVTNQLGRSLAIFNAKSLAKTKEYQVAAGADQRSLVLAFGGKGTKVLLWNGANPASKTEGLHFLPLELTKQDRSSLEQAYGALPDPPENYGPATELPANATTAAPDKPKPESGASVAQNKRKPGAADKKPSSGKKSANGPIASDSVAANLSLTQAEPGAKYLTDRGYAIKTLPAVAEGGTLILHDTGGPASWLEPKSLTLTRECTVFVAIQTKMNERNLVAGNQLGELGKDGWKPVDDTFETTTAGKEVWVWKMFSKSLKKGELDLATTINLRAPLIFIFK
jgi:hypothetical protein